MARTLRISNALHARLQAAARARGFDSVEQLLDVWQSEEVELRRREEAVHQIDALREQLFTVYGEMADSTALVCEDRAR